MTINSFVLKGELNGENRSGAFLFLSGIYSQIEFEGNMTYNMRHALNTMFCLLSVICLVVELFCSHTLDRYANSILYK